ncbi:MAG TPA: hypothetical protein PLY89_06225 [Synergistaceae bacterium]|nr:hypothetical protein [Synergistaceae bacterium]
MHGAKNGVVDAENDISSVTEENAAPAGAQASNGVPAGAGALYAPTGNSTVI